MKNHRRILFIVGPTACGKTEMALTEAQRLGAAILSCDSLCVYRGMDIGTAKPTPEEQSRVPHYGIDLAEPDEPYSVPRYVAYRDRVLAELADRGQPVIVAGGSGFYLGSFFRPVVDEIGIPAAISREVEAIRQSRGLEGLVRSLREVNPLGETFDGLDLRNPRRVEKALIRCRATGRGWRELRGAFEALPAPLADWRKEVWLIERSREDLQARNRARVQQMLGAGLVEEVRRLRAAGFENNPSACGAIGYREVLDFLEGKLPEGDLAESIYTHTNQLMRKQRTWFRHQIPVDRTVPV